MKTHSLNLQDIMLNAIRRERIPVTLTAQGEQFEGILIGFDDETLILNREDEQILFYKSNVSSVRVREIIMRT